MLLSLLATSATIILSLFTGRRWLFLWVALFRRYRPANVPVTETNVLVVVPFYNESQALPDCLQAIRRLDYPVERLAVLLVDDGSTDDSGRIAQSVAASLPHWATLHLPANVGKAAALNEAIRYYPHAPFLVVYDADERPQPDSLRLLLTGFGDEQVGGVTGRRVIGNGLNSAAATYATYENLVHQHLTCQAKETLHLYPPLLGSNCAYRLTALTAVGGFRPGAALEDSDLTIRLVHAGWQTRYLPQAISTTRAPETLAGYVAQHRRWAKGFVDVAHGEFRVSSFRFQVSGSRFQVLGFRLGVGRMLARVELFLFAAGYLDRAALLVRLFTWLIQIRQTTHHTSRITQHILILTLLTPLIQIMAALWLERSAAAYWFRLPLLPFFFLLDIITTSLGIGQSLLGIMLGVKRGCERLRDSNLDTLNSKLKPWNLKPET